MIERFEKWINENFKLGKRNKISYSPRDGEESHINDSLGKDKNFSLYEKSLHSINGEVFKCYSTYSAKINSSINDLNKSELLKALKGQSSYILNSEDIDKFIKASCILHYSKLKEEEIDFFISVESSSNLLKDFMKELEKRFVGSSFIYNGIIKNSSIENIYVRNADIPENSFSKIKRTLELQSEKDVSFKIKSIHVPYRKYVGGWLSFNSNMNLEKMRNKKIVLVDDFVSSGSTFIEAYNLLSEYTQNIQCITLLKNI